jgi:hypothetical protein
VLVRENNAALGINGFERQFENDGEEFLQGPMDRKLLSRTD